MKKFEKIMDGFEGRQQVAFKEIEKGLTQRFEDQEKNMHGTVRDLQKYVENVHDQQITDVEKLKKLVKDTALGHNYAKTIQQEMSSIERGYSMFENDKHMNCTKDFLILSKEQKRMD